MYNFYCDIESFSVGFAIFLFFVLPVLVVAIPIIYIVVKRHNRKKHDEQIQALEEERRREIEEQEIKRRKEIEEEHARMESIRKRREEQEIKRWQDYCDWLIDSGTMTDIKDCGDLIYDSGVGKWCKRYESVIFSAEEIVKVSLRKREATPTKHISENNKIFVETTNIDNPCVVFDCGTSFENAKRIESILNIFRNRTESKKTIK